MKIKLFLFAAILLSLFSNMVIGQVQLNGAGATFPYVIYSKWFDLYNRETEIGRASCRERV